jgi:hypothetical protein
VDSQYGIGVHADSGIAAIAARIFLSCRAVTENRTSNLRGRGQHRAGVERAVRADGERPAGSGVAEPADRLGQEALRAAGGAGRATAEPGEEHLPGLGQRRELRVVAADLGVAEPGANVRSAVWWNLRELLDPAMGAMLALPEDDELTADLTTRNGTSARAG